MPARTNFNSTKIDPSALVPGTRGKLQIVIADEGFEAGRLNTVSVVVGNPFDVAIEILEIQSPQSSLLKIKNSASQNSIDAGGPTLTRNKRLISKDLLSPEQEITEPTNFLIRVRQRISKISSFLDLFSFSSVVIGGISLALGDQKPLTFNVVAHEGSEVEYDQDLDEFENVNLVAEKNAKIKIKSGATASKFEPKEKILQVLEPHCELVAYMPLLTRGWMFFKPTRMNLSYLVRYRVAGDAKKILTQVVTSPLDIRPPLRSVVIGSILGSALGGMAKYAQRIGQDGSFLFSELSTHAPLEIVQLVGATIMSIIAAVALSRKSGAQNFITVEDFFGGFVIGVLIGYQGTSYFESILGQLGQTPTISPSVTIK